jgi:hypothetical protein
MPSVGTSKRLVVSQNFVGRRPQLMGLIFSAVVVVTAHGEELATLWAAADIAIKDCRLAQMHDESEGRLKRAREDSASDRWSLDLDGRRRSGARRGHG